MKESRDAGHKKADLTERLHGFTNDYFRAPTTDDIQVESLVDKLRTHSSDVLDTPAKRWMAGGVGAGLTAGTLMALLRDLSRQKVIDDVIGEKSKPGKGDLVVRVPRKEDKDDKQAQWKDKPTFALEDALGILASAVLAGGAYKGVTALDNMRVDALLKKKERDAKERFRLALEGQKLSAYDQEIFDRAARILGGEKQAELGKTIKTVAWLLGLGALGSSAYLTERIANANSTQYPTLQSVRPKGNRVIFKTYDEKKKDKKNEGEKESGVRRVEWDQGQLALAVLFTREQIGPGGGYKQAQLGGWIDGAKSRIKQRGADHVVEQMSNPATRAKLLKNERVQNALTNPDHLPYIQQNLDSILPALGMDNMPEFQKNMLKKPFMRGILGEEIKKYVGATATGQKYTPPGMWDVISRLLGQGFGYLKDRFTGIYDKFVNPAEQRAAEDAVGQQEPTDGSAGGTQPPVKTPPAAKPPPPSSPPAAKPPPPSPSPAAGTDTDADPLAQGADESRAAIEEMENSIPLNPSAEGEKRQGLKGGSGSMLPHVMLQAAFNSDFNKGTKEEEGSEEEQEDVSKELGVLLEAMDPAAREYLEKNRERIEKALERQFRMDR